MGGPTDQRLDSPRRREALRRSGTASASDASFDRFADLAARIVGAPVAIVSLVDASRQFFPGAVGLGRPWCDSRQTPLSHSFCQIVARTGEPLVVTDARADARLAGNSAIADLAVIAYAGMPLTDEDGHTLGSLAVIDHEPRAWTASELDMLRTLAAACAAELRLRISASRVADARAERERWTAQLARSLDASEATGRAETVQQVAEAVGRLVPGTIPPAFAALGVVDPHDGLVRLIAPESFLSHFDSRWRAARTEDTPLRRCVQDARQLIYVRQQDLLADFPGVTAEVTALGWESVAFTPLIHDDGAIGAILFAWTTPHTIDLAERAAIAAFTGYATQALRRIRRLDDRIAVAKILQQAMLTDVPAVDGLELVARYRPAHTHDQVGGDWYDAFVLPDGDIMLVIGDVAGHDITAAAIMGQLRSMLRGFAVDRPDTPAALLTRLDAANTRLQLSITATMIVARVSATDIAGARHVTWSNAGHPPPLMIDPDGKVEILSGGSPLLGISGDFHRDDHLLALAPGATLLFYTDGLVETRRQDLADGIEKLHQRVRDLAARPLPDLIDTLITELGGPTLSDDIAVLGCRIRGR